MNTLWLLQNKVTVAELKVCFLLSKDETVDFFHLKLTINQRESFQTLQIIMELTVIVQMLILRSTMVNFYKIKRLIWVFYARNKARLCQFQRNISI